MISNSGNVFTTISLIQQKNTPNYLNKRKQTFLLLLLFSHLNNLLFSVHMSRLLESKDNCDGVQLE